MLFRSLDNSLGAWWAKRQLTEDDLLHAPDEQALRDKLALPGVPFDYLRFVKDEEKKKWHPAGGWYEGWPNSLSELKVLDPSCGSGHFLVFAFQMLVPMRMKLEDLSAQEAADAVLKDNLNGLELDQRCVELAAFALALTAWTYPSAGGYRILPELNIACSGLAVTGKEEDWVRVAKESVVDPQYKEQAEKGMRELYRIFQDAPTLGSLIDPSRLKKDLFTADYEQLADLLEKALQNEEKDIEAHEMSVVAFGLAKAAQMLADKYHWVITNVPYLKKGKQSNVLQLFCDKYYPEAKAALETVFLERCLEFCEIGGTSSIVLPQNWLFLTSYESFRTKILVRYLWNNIALLGPKAFQTPMWDFNVQLITVSNLSPKQNSQISGLDVSDGINLKDKEKLLSDIELVNVSQKKQTSNPDARVMLYNSLSNANLLGTYAESGGGVSTFDSPRFLSCFWEYLDLNKDVYIYSQSTPKNNFYSGLNQVLKWEKGLGSLAKMMNDKKELENYSSGIWYVWSRFIGKKGVCISLMNNLRPGIYLGNSFDNNTTVLIPNDEEYLTPLFAYSESIEFTNEIRILDKKINVTSGTFLKIPFDLEYWQKVADEKYPNGLPLPYSDDPTQWIFHGHPLKADKETRLQVAIARLLGYRWPGEYDFDKKQKGETDNLMELSDKAWQYIEETQLLNSLADKDGIVCIPAVRGELSATDRVIEFLETAYGEEWDNNTLYNLLASVGHEGKSLENWLRDKFFTQHCKLFQHRPFIWHIWDGLNDGFSALVNYHKLDYKTLETLIYNYLGDWISDQEQARANGVDGAEEKLVAAENLKKELEAILVGEPPLDVFVRWKPLSKLPIGWNPDINDGVRMNIRPFMYAKDIRKKGAGILRDRPNVNWNKDRGKDVETAPWHNLGVEYGGKKGDRINDHHTTITEKKEAKKNGN